MQILVSMETFRTICYSMDVFNYLKIQVCNYKCNIQGQQNGWTDYMSNRVDATLEKKIPLHDYVHAIQQNMNSDKKN